MKPATELPWAYCSNGKTFGIGGEGAPQARLATISTTQRGQEQDAAYIVHAANAYPRLVAELKRLCVEIPKQLGSDKPFSNALLRELGEAE